MYDQMKHHNVRGLMIDIRYEDGVVELTHGYDNAGTYSNRMEEEVERFLNEEPNAVLWFDIEVTDGVLTANQFEEAMDEIPDITDKMFNPEHALWANHNEWPTMRELINSGQRIIMVVDQRAISGHYQKFTVLYRPDVTAENMWAKTDDSCAERHGYNERTINISGRDWSRLFTMNHFGITGDWVQAVNDNNWDGLFGRIEMCTEEAGIDSHPQFLGS